MRTVRVLVIDDEKDIRNMIHDFLNEQGYVVLTAENGEGGIKAAQEGKPDLIVLDLDLPDISGYEVCKKLKDNPETLHIPVLMLTAHTAEIDEIHGFKVGADDFVAKPFRPARLLARIQSAITRTNRELNANALTHLPGNVAISQEIEARIKKNCALSVLYFDLNNFKAFNDRYGFIRGDEAIRLTSDILSQEFSKWKGQKAFLGHVGGDDFVGMIETHDVNAMCDNIIQDFDKRILELYDKEDQKNGRIISTNRKGEKCEFPIMGLAIAVVTNRNNKFKHPGEISFIAGDLKKWVKSDSKSAFLVDRRMRGGEV